MTQMAIPHPKLLFIGPANKHRLTLLSCLIHIVQVSSLNTTPNNPPGLRILYNTTIRSQKENTINLLSQLLLDKSL